MKPSTFAQSPQLYVRISGLLYLAIILLGLFGESWVRGSLVVSGDAAATAQNIANAPLLWRAGIVGDLLMHVCDVPVIVVFYFLLRPINEGLALLATFINLMQTAVLTTNKLNLLLPLFLQTDSAYMQAFSPDQLHALSQIAIRAHGHGFGIGLIFFGFACLIRGYLIFQCRYLPKALGVLLAMAGVSYLINSFALLLVPAFADLLFPAILMPAFIGESALCLWLIFKGVNLEGWRKASPAAP